MEPDTGDDPIIKQAARLIRTGHTITLATACRNTPWAAPVYYAHIKGGFYFFSNPQSRHILETLASGQAAGAIYSEDAAWENLRGLQMSGTVSPVSAGMEAVSAVSAYVKKFPFVRSFFADATGLDLTAFRQKFQACLYCFKPERICYTDNALRFGFRKELTAGELLQ